MNDEPSGTGFFVAPGMILTCAHVVNPNQEKLPIKVVYKNKTYVPAKISREDIFPGDYPDLAILKVKIGNHPCVYLDGEYAENHEFYSYGYAAIQPVGEGVFSRYDGPYGKHELIKLKFGGIQEGFSGSPLLNTHTQRVCGMIQMSRDTASDLGGMAFPMNSIGRFFPQLLARNRRYLTKNKDWQKMGVSLLNPSASVSAIFYDKPGILGLPKELFGRDDLLAQAKNALSHSRRVLLTGMAGVGKTSIASMLAEQELVQQPSSVIWLKKVEWASVDAIMDVLADMCDKNSSYEQAISDNKKIILRTMLEKMGAKLLVFDDVENVSAMEECLQAIPRNLPVVITSRRKISTDEIIEVEKLEHSFALDLLGSSAGGMNFNDDPDARLLCADFEYLPYAIELCGQVIRLFHSGSPGRLRESLAKNTLNLSVPSNKDRNLRALLDDWVENLSDSASSAFLAFGAFPNNGLTSKLLASYLEVPVDKANLYISELVSYSLVKPSSAPGFYSMHKLTHDYVLSLYKENLANDQEVLNTVLNYLSQNSQDFEVIALDFLNLVALSTIKDSTKLVEIVSWIVIGGYPEPGPDSYFVNKGQHPVLLERLDLAIAYCRKDKARYKVTKHYLLGKRGDAHFNNGNYAEAISCYKEALASAPNKKREAIVSSVAARTYAISGQEKDAQTLFKKSYRLAKILGDELLLVSIMGQESHAAGSTGNYKKIKEIAVRQVQIARKIVNETPSPQAHKQLFFSLLNLGTAEMDLAKQGKGLFETALPILREVHAMALDQKSEIFLAYALNTLGEDYHYLNRNADAKDCFDQALKLWRRLGVFKYARELETLMRSLNYPVPD